jgi:hypothetical protein
MSQWSSEEWFVKWLELARVEMGNEQEEANPSPHVTAVSDTGSSFKSRQMVAADEQELAA